MPFADVPCRSVISASGRWPRNQSCSRARNTSVERLDRCISAGDGEL
jgi:hypothetical protein